MRSWIHSAPLVRIAIPFAIGTAMGAATEPRIEWCYMALCLAGVFFCAMALGKRFWTNYRLNPIFGTIAVGAFLSIGFAWAGMRFESRQYERVADPNDHLFYAVLDAYPMDKPNSVQLMLRVKLAADSTGAWSSRSFGTVAYMHKDLRADTLRAGDAIVFSSPPVPHQEPLNPHMFDYGRYLIHQGYVATVYLKSDVAFLGEADKLHSIKIYFERWRQRAIAGFALHSNHHDALGVIAALVLGKRDMVDPEIRQAFTDAGAVHILAVSGLHVGIIYLFASFLLGKMVPGERLKFVRLLISLAVLWLYAGITGFSPSVLRAATMFSFLAVGKQYNRFGNVFNMLAASVILLLFVNPFLVVAVGFQLSYLAVIGIVALHPIWYPKWVAPWWWLDRIWSLVVVSLAAQLATFPISMHYFNQFPNWFLLSNLVVIPLATLLLYGGIMGVLLSWIPYVSGIVYFMTDLLAHWLNKVVLLFQRLPAPVSEGLYFTKTEVGLWYLLFLAIGMAGVDPRRGRLRIAQVLAVALVVLFAYRKTATSINPEVYCFHANGHSLIAASQGRTALLFSPGLTNLNEPAITYATDGYFEARGVRSKVLYSEVGLVSLPGLKAVFVHNREEIEAAVLVGANAIVCRGPWDRNDGAPITIPPEVAVVIDSSVPWYRRSDLELWFERSGVLFHTTATQGAIRL